MDSRQPRSLGANGGVFYDGSLPHIVEAEVRRCGASAPHRRTSASTICGREPTPVRDTGGLGRIC
eukprot:11720145-Alexandrium_andersonii.AAC.1